MDMANFGLNFSTQNFQMPTLDFGNLSMPTTPDMTQFMSGGLGALEELIPGIGTQATNIPEMPSFEYFMDLQSMQTQHTQQKTDFSESFKSELDNKVDKVFEHFHYEYDSSGNPVMENGNPKMFEGAESPQSRGQRIEYETNLKTQLKAQQQTEIDAIDNQVKAIVNEMKTDPGTTVDPAVNAERQERLEALDAQKTALATEHDQEIMNKLYGHLPDPESTTYTTEEVLVNEVTNQDVTETTSVDNTTTTTSTTTNADGSTTTTAVNAEGATVATTTNPDGTTSTVTTNLDGTSTTVTDNGDGTTTTTNTDADGTVTSSTTTTTEESTTVNNTTVVDTSTLQVYEKVEVADASNANPMSSYINGKFNEYSQLEAAQTAEINNSEAGQVIAAFQAEMAMFTQNQYNMLNTISANQATLSDPTQYYDMDALESSFFDTNQFYNM